MTHILSALTGLVAGLAIALAILGAGSEKIERTRVSAVPLNKGTQVEYALPTPAQITTSKPASFSF
jgi:ribosomal protein S12 methylthiotransferase accessory factor YcaO